VVALFQFVGRIFREAVPHDDAMPLGFLVPLLVRTRPPSLRGERENRELASRLLCGFAFRVLTQKAHQFDSIFYILFLRFCPCNWGTRKREDAAPKASVCFLGGAQEIFDGGSEDLLGGTGKAEDAKLPGAGIIPKLCPM
jgi:hypothetical protein